MLMLVAAVGCSITLNTAAFACGDSKAPPSAAGIQDPDDPFAVPDEQDEPEDPKPQDPDDPFAVPDEEQPDDPEPQDPDDPFAEPDDEDDTDEPKVPDMVEPDPMPEEQPEPKEEPKKEVAPKKSDEPGEGVEPKPAMDAKPDSMPPMETDTKPMTDTAPVEEPESTTPSAAGTDVAFEQFRNLIQQMQANESEINQLVISMPVGFPDQRREQQARVDLLRQQNLQMIEELKPAAIESFEKFPNTQSTVTNYLLQQLQMQLTGKNFRKVAFDPVAAMPSYQRLVDGGVNLPIVHMIGYRVKYLLNDFDGSLASLKLASAAGQKIEPAVVQDLQTVSGYWKQEMELRTQDAEKQNPRVEIEMDCGNMVVELFEDQAPNTVANFITLVEDGFYNGLEFYLVSPAEVAVTGSPTNNGQGGPGYTIENETASKDMRHHFTGVLSMLPNQQQAISSQFLITKQPLIQYDGRILAFGRVIEGLGNLYKIQVINKSSAIPVNEEVAATKIIKMTVLRKRDHDYVPQKMMADSTPLPGG